jgi:hypothetical protein
MRLVDTIGEIDEGGSIFGIRVEPFLTCGHDLI